MRDIISINFYVSLNPTGIVPTRNMFYVHQSYTYWVTQVAIILIK